MKQKLLAIVAMAFPLATFAMQKTHESSISLDEQKQDTVEITTIADIIKEQQENSTRNSTIRHYNDVWGRRSHFDISFNKSNLFPKEDIALNSNPDILEKCRSNWGVSLEYGRNYRLHKKPIANILQFYIDYTGIDLSFSHYDIGGDGTNVYDSREHYTVQDGNTTNDYLYIPWNLEKYEGSYGMSIGPSMTIAPFTHVNNSNGLHYLKFNMYYRIGYQASILYLVNNEDADANPNKSSSDFKDMSDNLKMNWGHGLLTSFGFSLTWKAIGIGYEYRVAQNKYKSFAPSDFGDRSYKFRTSTNRIFLTFRLGR